MESNNIIDQLKEALVLLTDYPGIENVIDVKAAELFFAKLSKTNVALVPNFKEINPEKIEAFINESENSVEDWKEALGKLRGVTVWGKGDLIDPGQVIAGSVDANLSAFEGETDESFFFNFDSDDTASFNADHGTWEEVYLLIAKHGKEHLYAPTLPAEAK